MAQPIRIGILNDMAAAPNPGKDGDPGEWLRRAVDEVTAAGRIDRPVEFVRAWGHGLPGGTAAAVEHAFAHLVEQDALLIVGPAIGDNALVATPLADKYQTPALNWAGAERGRSEWMFHLQVGSHEDESLVMARHLHALGCTRIAVAFDRSQIGTRHLRYLEDEARVLGLRIAGTVGISPLAETAQAEIAELLESRPDGMVYLGLGLSAPAVATALTATGWTGPRIMNTAGMRGYHDAFAQTVDGWCYVDMFSDDNKTLTSLLARYGLDRRHSLAAGKGYDLGRCVAEAIARAPELTRAGLKHGLEQVKWLPAAEGYEGTLLGFGIQDRGALHGRYLVVRQWLDGQTVQAT
ncbi:MAG: ABC transporter substrate-binding protein [Sphingomonadales bacterium]|nr:ABC transporter substrate-binding protein [Sphingomonadales bacterium]